MVWIAIDDICETHYIKTKESSEISHHPKFASSAGAASPYQIRMGKV